MAADAVTRAIPTARTARCSTSAPQAANVWPSGLALDHALRPTRNTDPGCRRLVPAPVRPGLGCGEYGRGRGPPGLSSRSRPAATAPLLLDGSSRQFRLFPKICRSETDDHIAAVNST